MKSITIYIVEKFGSTEPTEYYTSIKKVAYIYELNINKMYHEFSRKGKRVYVPRGHISPGALIITKRKVH